MSIPINPEETLSWLILLRFGVWVRGQINALHLAQSKDMLLELLEKFGEVSISGKANPDPRELLTFLP